MALRPQKKAEIGKYYADLIKEKLPEWTETGLELPDKSYDLLSQNGDLFFFAYGSENVLKGKAAGFWDPDLFKNVLKYSDTILERYNVAIDDIKEYELGEEEYLNVAVGHTGGVVWYDEFQKGKQLYNPGNSCR